MKSSYRKSIKAGRTEVDRGVVNRIAAVGSFTRVKGGSLWREREA